MQDSQRYHGALVGALYSTDAPRQIRELPPAENQQSIRPRRIHYLSTHAQTEKLRTIQNNIIRVNDESELKKKQNFTSYEAYKIYMHIHR